MGADPLADCNASLINCRGEVSTLVKTNTQQSNTITSVNDQLNKAKNEKSALQADLNACDANSLSIKITANEYELKALDANTARILCQNNLNSALTQRNICLSDQNEMKTQITDANTKISNLNSSLQDCNNATTSQAQDILNLQTTILARNSTILDLNTQLIACDTEKQQFALDLTTTKEYLCNFDGNYCCDFNSLWMWC